MTRESGGSSAATHNSHNLFDVYLRLRPPPLGASTSTERFLNVEEPLPNRTSPTHITLNPPNDRRRAIEKFHFTQVFEEDASQLDVFHCTGVVPLVEGVLAPLGGDGTDALLATLGVTGSGKTHTILGSRSQRGLTQLSLDIIFRSLGHNVLDCNSHPNLESSVSASDPSEANIYSAQTFLETVYADPSAPSRASSRAPTPMIGESMGHSAPTPSRKLLNRPSVLPQQPDISSICLSCDPSAEYAVVISMYEVYNDRIFDLLTPPIKSATTKEYRRRPLLFKSTETSPDRKVVAGLRKVVCGSLHQALMVLEAGLHERRVAGTGSNSVSSRSHGFFCVEVKKRPKSSGRRYELPWGGSTMTIVDLAGSERARDAKTAGATLAEAGKINESLMYLGQCLQMQSDAANKEKPNLVPYRQCKLTELLFSNSFPSTSSYSTSVRRNPQKGVMIVTADPHGDFNATSQILRYSALAREIAVPRIPSITQTILSNNTSTAPMSVPQPCSSPVGSPPLHHRPFFPPGSTGGSSTYIPPLASPNVQRTFSPGVGGASPGGDEHRSTMELAALEIARLSEELDYMRQAFSAEQSARTEAEAHLESMEDRMIELEQAIREDCAAEFERRLEIEMSRWRANMQLEAERGEEHWGRKIEVFERTMATSAVDADDMDDDAENKENVLMEDVNEENERLRRDNEVLRRELALMSPTKRKPLQERQSSLKGTEETGSPRSSRAKASSGTADPSLQLKMARLRVSDDSLRSSGSGSPKKVRKLATKRWDAVDGDDLF